MTKKIEASGWPAALIILAMVASACSVPCLIGMILGRITA